MRTCEVCGGPETVLFQTDWVCLTNSCDKLTSDAKIHAKIRHGQMKFYLFNTFIFGYGNSTSFNSGIELTFDPSYPTKLFIDLANVRKDPAFSYYPVHRVEIKYDYPSSLSLDADGNYTFSGCVKLGELVATP